MKWKIITALSLLLFTLSGVSMAQSATCPEGMVCVSPAAARKALQDSDMVIAQAAEILTLREAVIQQKEVSVDVKIQLATAIGQLTAAQQEVIAARAQFQFVLLHGRNKCGGFTIICVQK